MNNIRKHKLQYFMISTARILCPDKLCTQNYIHQNRNKTNTKIQQNISNTKHQEETNMNNLDKRIIHEEIR